MKSRNVVAIALVSWSLAGCASTARISAFGSFATAGTQYTEALGALLDEAQAVAVDASSRKLLDSRDLAPVQPEAFEQQDAALRDLAGELQLLRLQTRELREYFRALASLAGSDAPEVFAGELDRTSAALDRLSSTLRDRPLARDRQAVQALAAGVGRLVVRGAQGTALERELAHRKETIAEVLLLQEALLAVLREQIAPDLERSAVRRYERGVLTPFFDSAKLRTEAEQQAWMSERRALLGRPPTLQQLDAAVSAARNLRFAWEKLLRNELTAADVRSVADDLVPILAAVGDLSGKEAVR